MQDLKPGAAGLFKKIIDAALTVKKLDDPDAEQARLDVCKVCDRLDTDKSCLECGCFVEVKATMQVHINPKTLKTEVTHCDLAKWPGDSLELVNYYRKRKGKKLLFTKYI